MLEEGKVKIGWNIYRVQNYIEILKCFKCCGYYHFARNCKKDVACNKHAFKECKSKAKQCVNCEKKIKSFRINNIDLSYMTLNVMYPHYKRELEKQKNILNNTL